ncbi:MAG: DEAD/DEAH box helicase [Chromatiaceae bacterium]|nr:MAG: DEAD/DEAH box helicase [Chromatiaceae bacterium]
MTQAFADLLLPEPLLRGIAKAGWTQPTPVQAQAIPAALAGADLLVSAATGSGKTGAFLLPMMQRFVDQPAPRAGTRGLILTPTRELARQILAHFHAIGSYTRLQAAVILGGEHRGHQVADLRRNPDLLIATPGRLLEHLANGAADLSDLEVLVLDEADRMLDLGLAADVLAIIAASNPARQSLLFSATLHHHGLRPVTERLLRDPRLIRVDPERTTPPAITHQALLSDDPEHKTRQCLWLLQHEAAAKVLVFTNTRTRAAALGGHLMAAQVRTAVLHGELEQPERRRVVDLFRRGQVRVLVATEVAARGLDLPGCELVINFEVPRTGDAYLHRAGRTGRAGAPGVAIALVGPQEWNRMESIVRYLRLELSWRRIAGLEARFQGPQPRRRARPAPNRSGVTARANRPKERLRERKNIGKRRQPSVQAPPGGGSTAGLTPPRRRSRDDEAG